MKFGLFRRIHVRPLFYRIGQYQPRIAELEPELNSLSLIKMEVGFAEVDK
jgi:hypothetical protein